MSFGDLCQKLCGWCGISKQKHKALTYDKLDDGDKIEDNIKQLKQPDEKVNENDDIDDDKIDEGKIEKNENEMVNKIENIDKNLDSNLDLRVEVSKSINVDEPIDIEKLNSHGNDESDLSISQDSDDSNLPQEKKSHCDEDAIFYITDGSFHASEIKLFEISKKPAAFTESVGIFESMRNLPYQQMGHNLVQVVVWRTGL